MSDTRPFFGDEPKVLSAPVWRNTNTGERGATPAMRYQWRLDEGLCPGAAGNCGGTLDEARFCSMCGQTWPDDVVAEREPDFIPTIPGALFVDEYAPADLDAA